MAWNYTCKVNPRVKVNLWLVNLWVNMCMEQLALSLLSYGFGVINLHGSDFLVLFYHVLLNVIHFDVFHICRILQ